MQCGPKARFRLLREEFSTRTCPSHLSFTLDCKLDMSKAYRRPIAADCDAADSYNAYVRPILLFVGLPVYLAYLAVNVSRTPKIDYGDGTAGYLNSRARDSGLRMEITSPFPESQLITHGVAAVLLFVLIVIQKESVRAMRGPPLP